MGSDSRVTFEHPCDVCGARSGRQLYTARDRLSKSRESFPIAKCDGCDVLRTVPDLTPQQLAGYYPDDYWGDDEDPLEDWIRSSQREKTAFVRRSGLPGGRVLDVGCGSGLFLRALDAATWERWGVETGPQAVAVARRSLGEDRVMHGLLGDAGFPDGYFDVVTFWSVLEHMLNPRAGLEEARRILKPGGSLIIQVPNAASYQARLFGSHWFALDAPRHRYHFTPGALDRLLETTGFKVYRRTFFSRSHNAHSLRQSLKSRLCADRLSVGRIPFLIILPLIKPIDVLMSGFCLGATMTVLAKKR